MVTLLPILVTLNMIIRQGTINGKKLHDFIPIWWKLVDLTQ